MNPKWCPLAASLVILASLSCGHSAAPASEPRTSSEPQTSSEPKPPGGSETSEAPAAASAHNSDTDRVEVTRDGVFLNGVRLTNTAEEKVARIEPLFDALRASGGDALAPNSLEQLANPTPYALKVEDEVGSAWLKSVFQTAAFAGYAPATLELDGAELRLRPLIPLPSSVESPLNEPPWPQDVLIILVHSEHTELWRAALPAPTTEGSSVGGAQAARQVARPSKDASIDELRHTFDAECAEGGCNPALVFVESPVPFSRFRRVLGALQASIRAAGDGSPVVELRINEPSQLPVPPRAPGRVRIGATKVSGRLAPELIQATLRANAGAFKQCYEAGLVQNSALKGRLMVRFVINRDGSVTQVNNDGSDLPDGVVTCLLNAFRKVVFKAPEGGVVTVVYPLVLAPE